MKKNYIKPTQRIHNVRIRTNMLDASPTLNMGVNNTETNIGDGGNLTKEHDLWGNEW